MISTDSPLDVLIAIAAFIVAIGVLVAVHEFGHFWVARRLGIKRAALLDRFRQAAVAADRRQGSGRIRDRGDSAGRLREAAR